MAFDKYVKLPGSERQPMPGATKTGSCDPNQLMQVTVVVRPRSAGKSQPSLADVVASGKRLSRDEYEARYGADPADVQKVQAFAAATGLAVSQVNLAARSVMLTGTCDAFAKAFQVSLATYEYKGCA